MHVRLCSIQVDKIQTGILGFLADSIFLVMVLAVVYDNAHLNRG